MKTLFTIMITEGGNFSYTINVNEQKGERGGGGLFGANL